MGCLPKLKKFLCCISLETGGLIIGWVNLIFSFLVLFGMITALSLTVVGYDSINSDQQDTVIGAFIVLMIFYSIFIIYYLIAFIAALFLIQGVKRRDHTRMVLFMILMAIGVILQFLQVLTAGWALLASALLFACLSAYFFLCIYSLYSEIKNEKMGQAYA